MNAGDLTTRGTIRQRGVVPDGQGGNASELFTTIDTVWANLVAGAGSETLLADKQDSRSAYTITIRFRPDVTPAMQFVVGTRVFDIKAAVDEEERHEWLILDCELYTP